MNNQYIRIEGKAFKVTIITSSSDDLNKSGEAYIATDNMGRHYGAEVNPAGIDLSGFRASTSIILSDPRMKLVEVA